MHVLVFLLAALMTPVQTASAPALTWSRPDHFWFRKAVPGGNLWLTVDAAHGAKEPLFDHGRLAIELNARTRLEFSALTLPFADPAADFVVRYDGSNAYVEHGAMVIEFTLDDRRWHCELQAEWDWNRVPPSDYECMGRDLTPDDRQATSRAANAPSPDGRWEAAVVNHNIVVSPLTPSAAAPRPPAPLSTDGTAVAPYDPGSIQWSADSMSLTAYRVNAEIWRSDAVRGSVKGLVTKGTFRVPNRDQ